MEVLRHIKCLLAEEYSEGDIDDNYAMEQSYLDAIDHWHKHQTWPEPEE